MREGQDILELLTKAKESLEAANALLDDGFSDFSASRSYYAMFYAAEAALLTKELSFSKHAAVIGAFGKEFIKTKIFPPRLRDYLINAFDLRQLGDYGSPGSIDKEKAQLLIDRTKDFIETIEKYLKDNGYKI